MSMSTMSGSFLRLQARALPRLSKTSSPSHKNASLLFIKPTNPLGSRFNRNFGAFGTTSLRFNSTAPSVETGNLPAFIEPTHIPEAATDATLRFGSFAELGLCNYTPVGLLEKLLEVAAVTTGLPWWATIGVVTITIRTLTLPLLLNTNIKSTLMHNVKPEMDAITARLTRAKEASDAFEMQMQSQKLQKLFKDNKINPLSMIAGPLIQAPIMLSFFLALRAMTEASVPGFTTGGLLWFTDISQSDPYYVLPVVSALGFLTSIELSAKFGPTASTTQPMMQNIFRGLALITIPATAHFPAAVFLYWIPSNLFSIFQLFLTSNSKTRAFLKLPKMIVHPPSKMAPKTGFFP